MKGRIIIRPFPSQVDAGAARHAPYPDRLFRGWCDAQQLLSQVPKRHQRLLQQVVDLQTVAAIATADREEQPAVAEHQPVESVPFVHIRITNLEGQKLQSAKKYFFSLIFKL